MEWQSTSTWTQSTTALTTSSTFSVTPLYLVKKLLAAIICRWWENTQKFCLSQDYLLKQTTTGEASVKFPVCFFFSSLFCFLLQKFLFFFCFFIYVLWSLFFSFLFLLVVFCFRDLSLLVFAEQLYDVIGDVVWDVNFSNFDIIFGYFFSSLSCAVTARAGEQKLMWSSETMKSSSSPSPLMRSKSGPETEPRKVFPQPSKSSICKAPLLPKMERRNHFPFLSILFRNGLQTRTQNGMREARKMFPSTSTKNATCECSKQKIHIRKSMKELTCPQTNLDSTNLQLTQLSTPTLYLTNPQLTTNSRLN